MRGMSMSLRQAIDTGDYEVDADAVAEAIVHRVRSRGARLTSEVLVPPKLLELAFTRPSQLDAGPLDDPA